MFDGSIQPRSLGMLFETLAVRTGRVANGGKAVTDEKPCIKSSRAKTTAARILLLCAECVRFPHREVL
jgi:hypothetical protein